MVLTAGLAFSQEHVSAMVLQDASFSIRTYTNMKKKKMGRFAEPAASRASEKRAQKPWYQRKPHICTPGDVDEDLYLWTRRHPTHGEMTTYTVET